MPSRRLVAVAVVACLAAVAGCDDDSSPAAVETPAVTPTASAPASPTASPTATPTATPGNATFPTYVALGDSYSAAPGVPQTEQETGCARSSGNYPTLVAAQLGSELDDVTCSGASTLSLVGAQQASGHVLPPQFAALAPDTSLVTVGIGGNDLDLFQTMVGTCVQLGFTDPQGAPCQSYLTGSGKKKDVLVEKIDAIHDRVTSVLEGIRNRAPQARVILVGYPQPVPASGGCPTLPLAKGDYPYVRAMVVRLNVAMRDAADQAGTDFVDMVRASKGHDICAGADAWVNGVDSDPARAIAFHPFAEEQQAVAGLIVKRLGSTS